MKKVANNLFSKDKVNTSRQLEVDLLKGFSLLIICICHVGLYLNTNTSSWIYYFSDIIGSEPAAPVFMVLMGLGIVYSKKQSAFSLFLRGIELLVIALLINLIRSCPYWIINGIDYFASLSGFFVVDIMQLAGLSFILFGLFKIFKMPHWLIFVISIIFLIFGQILMSYPNIIDFKIEATYILNLFLPLNNDYCCFNLLTWFIYPSFGLILGDFLIRCKNKNKFYLILMLFGLIGVIILYSNIIMRFPNYASYYYGNNYYRMGVLNSFVTILVVCFLLALWYFLSKLLPSFIIKYLTSLSKNVTIFYILSWVFLTPLIHFQAYFNIELNNFMIVILTIITILFSSFLSLLIYKINLYFKYKPLKKNQQIN